MLFTPLLALAVMKGPMVINADISNGETISKLRTIKVRVQSDSVVTQVEFYVNADLRDSATSTPYTFTLDPLTEPDGDEKLTFTAYNTDGAKLSKSLTVHIDSGASKGAEANTAAAQDFLTQSKWDDAIFAARVALKAKADYVPAEIVLGHAFLSKGVYDKAQEFTEDALRTEPNSAPALELLAAIQLERAFNSYAASGDPNSVLDSMADAITKAIDARRKAVDEQFDKLPAPTSSNLLRYADTADQTFHYSAAVSALLPAFSAGFKTEIGNRIAYAQLRLGRFDDLQHTLDLMKANNTLDGYSYAILAVASQFHGDPDTADTMIKEAIEEEPNNVGVQTAQVYLALQRNNLDTMSALATNLGANQGQLPEVNYYLAILYDRLKRYDDSDKAFQQTVLTEPLSYEMYIERGNESLLRISTKAETGAAKATDIQIADHMYQAARESKPDSAEALTASTILDVIENKPADSTQMADASVAAAPKYAPAHLTAAVVYAAIQSKLADDADTIKRNANGSLDSETLNKISSTRKQADLAGTRAQQEYETAKKLDERRLGGTSMPALADAFHYFVTYGGLPVITPPS